MNKKLAALAIGLTVLIMLGTIQTSFLYGTTFLTTKPGYTLSVASTSTWWDCNWSYAKKITIDHTKVQADETNFPVLLYEASDADLAAYAQDNGNDIVFVDRWNVTQYNHELEKFDGNTGELWAWVNVTSLSSTRDTIVYMYYGNPDCGSQQHVSETWDSGYAMVQHLSEASGTTFDSTSHDNDGTPVGSVTQNVIGKIDGAVGLDGTTGYINTGTNPSLNITNQITVEAWVQDPPVSKGTPVIDSPIIRIIDKQEEVRRVPVGGRFIVERNVSVCPDSMMVFAVLLSPGVRIEDLKVLNRSVLGGSYVAGTPVSRAEQSIEGVRVQLPVKVKQLETVVYTSPFFVHGQVTVQIVCEGVTVDAAVESGRMSYLAMCSNESYDFEGTTHWVNPFVLMKLAYRWKGLLEFLHSLREGLDDHHLSSMLLKNLSAGTEQQNNIISKKMQDMNGSSSFNPFDVYHLSNGRIDYYVSRTDPLQITNVYGQFWEHHALCINASGRELCFNGSYNVRQENGSGYSRLVGVTIKDGFTLTVTYTLKDDADEISLDPVITSNASYDHTTVSWKITNISINGTSNDVLVVPEILRIPLPINQTFEQKELVRYDLSSFNKTLCSNDLYENWIEFRDRAEGSLARTRWNMDTTYNFSLVPVEKPGNNDIFLEFITGAVSPGCPIVLSMRWVDWRVVDTSANITINGTIYSANLGNAVATGDFNGDGKADALVGACKDDVTFGKAYIFFGGSPTGIRTDANANVTLKGTVSGGYFGYSVAMGDFNGDGKADALVGAYYNASGGTLRGCAKIFFGGPPYGTRLASAANVTFDGTVNSAYFGCSVAMGDFNGDGKKDALVGAYNNGTGNTLGCAKIFFGGTPYGRRLASAANVTFDGTVVSSNFGYSVAMGDFNGDSKADALVGANNNGTQAGTGCAKVFFGGTPYGRRLASAANVTFDGTAGKAYFGCAVAMGDFNGDSKADALVGAYGNLSGGTNRGCARVFFGGSPIGRRLASAANVTFDGTYDNSYLGYAVAMNGDFNGDGKADALVGAYGNGSGAGVPHGNSNGTAKVFFGGTPYGTRLASSANVTFDGTVGGQLGFSVALGDFNGDGKADALVGANADTSNEGKACAFFGGTPTGRRADTSANVTFDGTMYAANMGYSVAVGDFNGDGKADAIVGAYKDDYNIGKVYIFFGASPTGTCTESNANVTLQGTVSGGYFGYSVTTGDFNGDGKADVLVGAYCNASGGTNRGCAKIFFGGPPYGTRLATAANVTFDGTVDNAYLGYSVAMGDFNGDGKADALVGAYQNTSGGIARGCAKIFFGGSPTGRRLATAANVTFDGTVNSAYFGNAVAMGDFNGDGKQDALIGAYNNGTGNGAGKGNAKVFFGGTPYGRRLASAANVTFDGTVSNSYFGWSVAMGDFNNDGKADALVGADQNTSGGTNRGCAKIFFGGSPTGTRLATAANVTFDGTVNSAYLGYSVAMGDFNGDGKADALVGAYQNASGGTARGCAKIFYGGSPIGTRLSTAANMTYDGTANTAYFGCSVALGDINNDGKKDVLVGAYNDNSGEGMARVFFDDNTPPSSSVNSISLYWKTSTTALTATASDGQSGLRNVTLYYRFSSNNASWGSYVKFGIATASPWSWSFTFPNGTGYYQFYSIARDNASNVESAPGTGDAQCGYDNILPESNVEPTAAYWKSTSPTTLNGFATDSLYERYTTGDDASWPGGGTLWKAQTFTVGNTGKNVNHQILGVRLKMYRSGTPGTITVGIRATNATGYPTGSDLTNGTINGNSLTTDTDGLWYTILFTSAYTLTASTTYAIVVRSSSTSGSDQFWWRMDSTSPTYTGGSYFNGPNSGTWSPNLGIDFMFVEYSIEISGLKNVTLWYRYRATNTSGWGGWVNSGLVSTTPWVGISWSFPFSNGTGHYQFYSIARDNASNVESAPSSADAQWGYDIVAPSSSVDTISPYWTKAAASITATASDDFSGVKNVTLWYRYSANNASWGGWVSFGVVVAAPWGWSFSFSNGSGYYQFYSIARDNATNTESAPGSADAKCGYDNVAPTSSVNTVSPYWWSTSPITLTATASDATSGVKNVTLYYKFSSNNVSFGGWVNAGVKTALPWSWSFSFSNGSGYYQFYSVAKDNATNTEAAPVSADTRCGYDTMAPSSSVDALSPYWKKAAATITATASDALSGVKNVTLWYRFSTNNASWGGWVNGGLKTALPWSWSFLFTNGSGYYQFYSIAKDNATNVESAPGSPDAQCGYDTVKPGSNVNTITPCMISVSPLTINATATDSLSGVKNVTLWYCYSTDNTTWGTNWYNTNWQYRKKITIDHTKVAANLTNFPMLVSITDTNLSTKAQSSGNDILFTTTSGTKLNHEIESYNSTIGALVVWVNVTSLSSTADTVLFMYYGNPSASSQQNRIGTWDGNFQAVWHLGESTNPYHDSTSHKVNSTGGTYPTQIAGQIGNAQNFVSASSQFINFSNGANSYPMNMGTNDWTVSAWIKTGSSVECMVSKGSGTPGPVDNWQFRITSNLQSIIFMMTKQGVGSLNTAQDGTVVGDNVWHYVTVRVVRNDQIYRYVDGSHTGTDLSCVAFNGQNINSSQAGMIGGRDLPGNANFFNGVIDEVRISKIARSANWISTEYNNQKNPGTFLSTGPEQPFIKWNSASNPDTSAPWSWSFTFPNSTGYYQFYSIANDTAGNKEDSPSSADARCHYINDTIKPTSSVNAITPYWQKTSPLTITVTASDTGGSGLKNVSLYYYSSTTNTTWNGPWKYGLTNTTPWITPLRWSFTFPNGTGYYRFYSVSYDNATNKETFTGNDTNCGYDTVAPVSSIDTITSYWKKSSPLAVTATASDSLSGVKNVSLNYRFSSNNNSWGGYVSAGVDTASPWGWSFSFSNGTGYYQFYSIAKDNATNTESAPGSADAVCGYDVTAPSSSVDAISPYWKKAVATITATASDATSGVKNVTLYYRFSSNNASWGGWVSGGVDTAAPWSWSFTFSNGTGYYQFYSIAKDNATNVEAPPARPPDASCGYDNVAPSSTVDTISPYWKKTSPLTIAAAASDTGYSGVKNVTLYYCFSNDNASFGHYVSFGVDTAKPWSWSFTFSNGTGYYRFYSIAKDNATNTEAPPGGLTTYDTQCGYDNIAPTSSVNAISPYWKKTSPLTITATASDTGYSGVKNVTLYYRFSSNNASWGGWTSFSVDTAAPWSWSFTFPNGTGYYQFYSIAKDNATNTESPPSDPGNPCDTKCGYDTAAPSSSVNAISLYWQKTSPLTITATASDATSGVKNVTLYYRYSINNASWGSYVSAGVDTAAPWSWSFSFSNGTGYYQFYSIAKDNATNTESAPGSADARCGYDNLAPTSSVNSIVPYVRMNSSVTISATASDNGPSGLKNVTLKYRYSPNNSSWGAWTSFGIHTTPWSGISWSFPFSNGTGYYEYYSIATDNATNQEAAPGSADAKCRYLPIANPTVITNASTGVEETNATLHGYLQNDGGESCTVRFQYGITTNYGTNTTNQIKSTGNTFQQNIIGLTPGQRYHFRAYANNTAGSSTGNDAMFLTKPNPPTSLLAQTNTSTKIYLTWTKGTGANTTRIQRKIGGYPSSITDGTTVFNLSGTHIEDTGLSPGMTYYYRAWSYSTWGALHQWSNGYASASATTKNVPVLSNENPANGSINVILNTTLSIHVSHSSGYQMNITWYWGLTSSCPYYIGRNATVTNGTYGISNDGNFSSNSQTYYWRVTVNDGHGEWTNATYHFSTILPNKKIISKGRGAYALEISPAGTTLYGYINGNNIQTSFDTSWHCVSLTYDGSHIKLYKDGALQNTTTFSGSINTNANDLLLGEYLSGKLDEVRVSSTARSAAWINTTYLETNSPTTFATFGGPVGVLSTWAYRKKVTINHSLVSATLSNFPVLVFNASDINLKGHAQSTGNDILFMSSTVDWTTGTWRDKLNFEIEKFDHTTGELEAWVRIPTLSASTDTDIDMYYGNSLCNTSRQDPMGVWDSSYCGVWHLKEAGSGALGEYADSTSKNNNGRGGAGNASRVPTFTSSGRIDGANDFDGVNDYVDASGRSSLNITGSLTLEAWIHPDIVTAHRRILQFSSNGTPPSKGYLMEIQAGQLHALLGLKSGGTSEVLTGTIPASAWTYMAVTWNTSVLAGYINGRYAANSGPNANDIDSPNTLFRIGSGTTNTSFFQGILDEVRISNTKRSAAWINTTFNTINKTNGFLWFGKQMMKNIAPAQGNPSPSNGAIQKNLNPSLRITVYDTNQDALNVTFRTNASGSWTTIGTNTSVTNGSYQQQPSTMIYPDVTYYWSVNVTDRLLWTNATYHFTTAPQELHWWNSNWSYRKLLTVNHSQVNATLTDFPILVHTPSDSDLAAHAQDDGDDIAFVLYSDNSTQLKHEIEVFNGTSGALTAWVNVTSLSSTANTNIWMYYGNTTCSSQQSVTGTWDSHFKFVSHLEDGLDTSHIHDSTSNGNSGTKKSAAHPAVTTSGRIANGQDFASTDYIELANESVFDFEWNSPFTLEAWINLDSVAATSQNFLSKLSGTDPYPGWEFSAYDPTGGSDGLQVYLINSYASKYISVYVPNILSTSTWYYVSATYNGNGLANGIKIYKNGTAQSLTTLSDTLSSNSIVNNKPVSLGIRDGSSWPFAGLMDEVRISNVQRNSSWIITNYNTMTNPSTFLFIGSEQKK